MAYAWKASINDKDNPIFKEYAEDLMWTLVKTHKAELSEFKQEQDTINSKYNYWWQLAFSDALKDKDFTEKFNEMYQSKTKVEAYIKEKELELKKRVKTGANLGIPKIVLVSPKTYSTKFKASSSSYSENVEYMKNEKKQQAFLDMYKDNAVKMGLKMESLSTMTLKATEAEKYDDLVLLNEWFYEQNRAGSMAILGTKQEEMERFADKYKTDYFLWTGYYYQHQPASLGIKTLAILWLFTNNISIDMLNGDNNLFYYAILCNVRTGKMELIKFENFDMLNFDANINGHIYDALLQIKENDSKEIGASTKRGKGRKK